MFLQLYIFFLIRAQRKYMIRFWPFSWYSPLNCSIPSISKSKNKALLWLTLYCRKDIKASWKNGVTKGFFLLKSSSENNTRISMREPARVSEFFVETLVLFLDKDYLVNFFNRDLSFKNRTTSNLFGLNINSCHNIHKWKYPWKLVEGSNRI